uniref:U-box domain-containing protein n=1 Tax=Zea mays TaxID=4577 RepID=A0A804RB95_MAIZE
MVSNLQNALLNLGMHHCGIVIAMFLSFFRNCHPKTLKINMVTIGCSMAIPALVQLLSNGSQRGKKDAATTLFKLCSIYQGNKGKAVRAGLVPILLELLMETESGMVDEALAILAILSGHPEGKAANGAASAVPVLVGVVRNGSPRSKENAAAAMVHLYNGLRLAGGRLPAIVVVEVSGFY